VDGEANGDRKWLSAHNVAQAAASTFWQPCVSLFISKEVSGFNPRREKFSRRCFDRFRRGRAGGAVVSGWNDKAEAGSAGPNGGVLEDALRTHFRLIEMPGTDMPGGEGAKTFDIQVTIQGRHIHS
jgi:hypothetical protein